MPKELIDYRNPIPMPGVAELDEAVRLQDALQKCVVSVLMGETLNARKNAEVAAELLGIALDYDEIKEAEEMAAQMAEDESEEADETRVYTA